MRAILLLLPLCIFSWVPRTAASDASDDSKDHCEDTGTEVSPLNALEPQNQLSVVNALEAPDRESPGASRQLYFNAKAAKEAAKRYLLEQRQQADQIAANSAAERTQNCSAENLPTFREVWARRNNFGPVALALFRALLMLVPDTLSELILSGILLHYVYGVLDPLHRTLSRLPLAWLPSIGPYGFEVVRLNLILDLLALFRFIQYCAPLARTLRIAFLFTPLVNTFMHVTIFFTARRILAACQEQLLKQEPSLEYFLGGIVNLVALHIFLILIIAGFDLAYASRMARLKAAI
jgi:hypothetical protein